MLTILHDRLFIDGKQIETASAEGMEVMRKKRATCHLASVLIEQGYDGEEPVRLVRADPYLFAAPHKIEGVTLSVAARVDFFGDDTVERTPESTLQLGQREGHKS